MLAFLTDIGVKNLLKLGKNNTFYSVPNSSYELIFVKIRAKYGQFFGKNRSVIRAKIRAKFKF